MAGQIEKFLLHKLDLAIDETKSMDHSLPSILFGVQSEFSDLKECLQANTGTSQTQRRENLYYLNNLLSEWKQLSKGHKIYTPEGLNSAHKLSKKIKKIKTDLKGTGTGEVRKIPDTDTAEVSLQAHLDTYRWSFRTVDLRKVYGLEDKERFLERLLVRKEPQNGFKAAAIVGMPGVGKTTLCQLMFNNEKVKEHFLPRIWVCLSKQPEDDQDYRKEVVKRMLMCLGVDDDIIEKSGACKEGMTDLGLERLIFALRLQLIGKRYLVVFDDVWNSDEFFQNLSSEGGYGQLAYGLPKGNGGTIVITTRTEEIAKNVVGEKNVHHLPVLKDREICWQIFTDSVQIDFSEELKLLKDLIVDKCAGLPLAAKMMGEIKYQELQEKQKQSQVQEE